MNCPCCGAEMRPVRGRYEVRRRKVIVWVAERDIATWTATPPEKPCPQ